MSDVPSQVQCIRPGESHPSATLREPKISATGALSGQLQNQKQQTVKASDVFTSLDETDVGLGEDEWLIPHRLRQWYSALEISRQRAGGIAHRLRGE